MKSKIKQTVLKSVPKIVLDLNMVVLQKDPLLSSILYCIHISCTVIVLLFQDEVKCVHFIIAVPEWYIGSF